MIPMLQENSMLTVNVNISNSDEAARYISECETELEKSLQSAADAAISRRDVRIITLAGPTCSGKTTAAAKLCAAAEARGLRARVLSIDDFYRGFDRNLPEPNYETAEAIDTAYFAECVDGLLKGKRVMLPTFDFKIKKRAALTEYVPKRDDIYVFEGIQAMYPEITSAFGSYPHTSIAIGVFEDVKIGETFFDKNDIRLARRLLRDYRFRATDINTTMRLWKTVRENEEVNIYPYLLSSEIKINSFLRYEMMYIGKELVPVLNASFAEKASSDKAKEICKKLENVSNTYFTRDMIPLESLFREFIG